MKSSLSHKFKAELPYYTILASFYVILTILTLSIPFFWDNIALISKPAQAFYEQHLQILLLPPEFNPIHPPFYAYYLAVIWTVFGKSLAAMHWAILPFLFGVALATLKIAFYFFPSSGRFWAGLFIIIQPGLLAQGIYAGSDLPYLCGIMFSLMGILTQKRYYLTFGLIFVLLTNLKGLIWLPILFVIDVLVRNYSNTQNYFSGFKSSLTKIYRAYLPGCILVVAWFVYQYLHLGYFIYPKHSHWSQGEGFFGNFSQMLRSLAVSGGRLLDNGHIIGWTILLFCLFIIRREKLPFTTAQSKLLLTLIVSAVLFPAALMLRDAPNMHRYFIPVYLLLWLAVLAFIEVLQPITQKIVVILSLAALLSGHWWVYPYPIANSWDNTLATLPYFKLNAQADIVISNLNTSKKITVGTEFPLYAAPKYKDLTDLVVDGLMDIGEFSGKRDTVPYFLWSNVSNDFPPELHDSLSQYCNVLWQGQDGFIKMTLFECQ